MSTMTPDYDRGNQAILKVAEPRHARLRPDDLVRTSAAAIACTGAVLARNGLSDWAVVEAASAALLVWVAVIDLETRLLPNRLVLPATALILAAAGVLGSSAFLAEHAISAFAAGGFFLFAAAIRPGELGMGDAKLALLLGALLGADVLRALVVAFGLLALVALLLLARHGRLALKRHLPLGPFFACAAITTLLLGGGS